MFHKQVNGSMRKTEISGFASCQGINRLEPKARAALTEGMIVVGYPEVFSYSRLIEQARQEMGYTTYNFNFKITVVPGLNTCILAEAALNMTSGKDVSKNFFRRWRKDLQADPIERAFGVQSRWHSGALSSREKITLQQSASQLRH